MAIPEATPADLPPDGAAPAAEAKIEAAERKLRKKRNKVRSAWISFVGRILAHVTGALATISLGLLVVHQYGLPDRGRTATAQVPPAPDRPALARVATPGTVAIAVLPFETHAQATGPEVADAVANALIAGLAGAVDMRVLSRTSTLSYRSQPRPVPVIAKELGVDLIVEGAITSAGGRIRAIVQLIDATRDEHLWAASYERRATDLLAVQSEVAAIAAREIQQVVRGAWRNGRAADARSVSVPAGGAPALRPPSVPTAGTTDAPR